MPLALGNGRSLEPGHHSYEPKIPASYGGHHEDGGILRAKMPSGMNVLWHFIHSDMLEGTS